MQHLFKLHGPSPALMVACAALIVSLSGTGYAAFVLPANSVGAKQLRKNAVTSKKLAKGAVTGARVKDNSLRGADILESGLGKVRSAAHADSAASATNAAHAISADSAHPSGSAGGALSGSFPSPTLTAPESYREVGAPRQPPFCCGWHNVSTGNSTAAFYKDPYGIVHVKGSVDGGAASSAIFTLPNGYRPTKVVSVATLRGGAPAVLSVGPNGAFGESTGPPSGFLALDGVTFRAGAG